MLEPFVPLGGTRIGFVSDAISKGNRPIVRLLPAEIRSSRGAGKG